MIGYVLGSLIRQCLHLLWIRRVKRWPVAEGTDLRTWVGGAAMESHPCVLYKFTVESREYFGDVSGVGVGEQEARVSASRVEPGSRIVVRYKPKDPSKNTGLNDDNRDTLAFVIDE